MPLVIEARLVLGAASNRISARLFDEAPRDTVQQAASFFSTNHCVSHSLSSPKVLMVYRHVSDDLKRAAVRMCRVLSVQTVSIMLDISEITIRRAIKNFNETGDVAPLPTGIRRGRRAILEGNDANVSVCGHMDPCELTSGLVRRSLG